MPSSSMQNLVGEFTKQKIQRVKSRYHNLLIEIPSWGFGRGGTRFEVYKGPDDLVTTEDRIKAGGLVHRLTGQGKTMALHFPWDGNSMRDVENIKGWLKEAGLKAGAVNSNMFNMRPGTALDHRLRFGSFTSPCADVQKASIEHNMDCLGIMRTLGSKNLSVWVPDGTNSPGQMSLYEQMERLEYSLKTIYKAMRPSEVMLVEYKFFEPGFYATAIPDWGRSLKLTEMLGKNAKVLVDLGHHPLGTNIEQIVANLMWEGKLGGFHFNDKKFADDDLATGSIDPMQLFRIFCALVEAEDRGLGRIRDLAFMIDQSHCIKDATEEILESMENIETAYLKALLVDFSQLRKYQHNCQVGLADRLVRSAFLADVRPLLQEIRRSAGLPAEPLMAYKKGH